MERIRFEITEDFDIYVSKKDENTNRSEKKLIEIKTLLSILEESMGTSKKSVRRERAERDVLYSSPIFPSYHGVHVAQHIIKDKDREFFILQREKRQGKFAFYDDVFDNIGLPGMIFMLQIMNEVIVDLRVFAIKDEIITESTELYAYPFPNVSSSGGVCLGSNNLSEYKIKSANNLHSFPSMFFMMPATHELRNQNTSGLNVRPLLQKLKGNEFNDDYLVKSNINYGDLITGRIG